MSFERVSLSSTWYGIPLKKLRKSAAAFHKRVQELRFRSDRRLRGLKNLNKAVKIRAKTSVKYGCNEKLNNPPLAFQDALGLDIGRDQKLSLEYIDRVIKTQGLQLRWKLEDPPLGDLPILSFTLRHVEGFKAGEIPAFYRGKLYEIRPRPRSLSSFLLDLNSFLEIKKLCKVFLPANICVRKDRILNQIIYITI